MEFGVRECVVRSKHEFCSSIYKSKKCLYGRNVKVLGSTEILLYLYKYHYLETW